MKPFAIFDMDGTILDSMIIWDHLATDYLKMKGIIAPANIEEFVRTMSFQESAYYFIQQFSLPLSVAEVMEEMNSLIQDYYCNIVQLKPFVLKYLQHLQDLGVRMCIATASPLEHAESALRRLQVLSYFDYILTCDEVGFSKERPDIYYQAAQKWGVTPDKVMVFEDALHAIQNAKEAGFYTIGVYDPSAMEDSETIKRLCDQYIINFNEMGK